MKPSDIKPGLPVVIKVNGTDQVATVIDWSNDGERVIVRTRAGNQIYRSPRQLKLASSGAKGIVKYRVESTEGLILASNFPNISRAKEWAQSQRRPNLNSSRIYTPTGGTVEWRVVQYNDNEGSGPLPGRFKGF